MEAFSNGVPDSSKDLFDVGASMETTHGVARAVRDYTHDNTTVGYIIRVRTRLFSPSSPGESFLVPPAVSREADSELPFPVASERRT